MRTHDTGFRSATRADPPAATAAARPGRGSRTALVSIAVIAMWLTGCGDDARVAGPAGAANTGEDGGGSLADGILGADGGQVGDGLDNDLDGQPDGLGEGDGDSGGVQFGDGFGTDINGDPGGLDSGGDGDGDGDTDVGEDTDGSDDGSTADGSAADDVAADAATDGGESDGGESDGGDGPCAATADCAGVFALLPCEVAVCLPDGTCAKALVVDGTPCDDGDACTWEDTCSSALCGGTPLICKDDNPCTTDSCDATDGCGFAANTVPCDDGNACTAADTCADGACAPGESSCACDQDADCAAFEDGNQCNGTLACLSGFCEIAVDSVVVCPNGEDSCATSDCAPATGACVASTLADGSPCDDDDACSSQDTCVGGTCAGVAAGCDDGNACTTDSCAPATGICAHTGIADGDACDDGDTCTPAETCDAGACVAAGTIDCDDGDPCTIDGCAAQVGCTHDDVNGGACDDGDACTVGDQCQAGGCAAGENTCACAADSDCEDLADDPCKGQYGCLDGLCAWDADKALTCPAPLNPCALSSCDGAVGGCVETTLADGSPCDDGDACTTADTCVSGSCAAGAALDCDDGDPCTVGDDCVGAACEAGSGTPDCDDGNPCTADACVAGQGCAHPADAAATCSDGDPCTFGDDCIAGSCKPGTDLCGCKGDSDCAVEEDGDACNGKLVCAKGSLPWHCVVDAATVVVCPAASGAGCTAQACNPQSGFCEVDAKPEGAPCDDGDDCTLAQGEVCSFGVCQAGAAVDCDDGEPCTEDACDSHVGCTHQPLEGSCDDGDKCTLDTLCKVGVCGGGGMLACKDGNPCTDDVCNAALGCIFVPSAAACDDGDDCTTGDGCKGGQCQGGGNNCQCQTTADCGPLDNADLCDGSYVCQAGVCVIDPLSVVSCVADDVCNVWGCQPQSGKCTAKPANQGASCDDGDGCSDGETCDDGACLGGAPVTCDDGNTCTDDPCASPGGCVSVAVDDGQPCSDGSACTVGEACDEGACKGGSALPCDDGNACTWDACDKAKGCLHDPLEGSPCGDGDPCTIGDVCTAKVCVPGAPKACPDGGACKTIACDDQTGACKTTVVDGSGCDDGSKCTTGDVCKAGNCTGKGVDCNDGSPCTDDSCDPKGGCGHVDNNLPCSDGNPCTSGDGCSQGTCQPGKPVSCNDGNACTDDFCDKGTGQCAVKGISAPCDDGNACTTGDACSAGSCSGQALDCDDNNACTTDACNAQGGCSHASNGLSCDDGDACTTGDSCSGGDCAGKPANGAELCDDGKPCTTDACEAALGCLHVANQIGCDDGNPCTLGDTCDAGACASGANTCGCESTADCAPLEDQNICNGTLYCDKSDLPWQCSVNPGTVIACDTSGDGFCGATTCNPSTGACETTAKHQGEACDADGSVCTVGDVCDAGACAAGSKLDCDDNNACTDDACDGSKGCSHAANTAPCDDGNACTKGDGCKGGACVSGPAQQCKDGNPCTLDACDPSTGQCVFDGPAADGQSCDADGSLCTVVDTCDGGKCLPGAKLGCDDGNACTSDSCLPDSGCTHVANAAACDDGSACTDPDHCAGGVCVGQEVGCDDFKPCTIDSCQPAIGCKHVEKPDKTACGPTDLCWAGSCLAAKCGDSVVTVAIGEECDDGNTSSGDGCSSGCKKEDTACDDGTRDGTLTFAKYPKVALCSGGWTGHIGSSNPSGLCGDNWHVCNGADHNLLLTIAPADAFQPGCWALNAANDFGQCSACQNGPDSNDMSGLGKDCQGKVTNYGSCCISNSYRIDAATSCVRGNGQMKWISGVVCCANE